MPRYFFDVHDGDDIHDDIGMELASDEAARDEAYGIVVNYASNPINLRVDGIIVVTTRKAFSPVVTVFRMIFQEETVDLAHADV